MYSHVTEEGITWQCLWLLCWQSRIIMVLKCTTQNIDALVDAYVFQSLFLPLFGN